MFSMEFGDDYVHKPMVFYITPECDVTQLIAVHSAQPFIRSQLKANCIE